MSKKKSRGRRSGNGGQGGGAENDSRAQNTRPERYAPYPARNPTRGGEQPLARRDGERAPIKRPTLEAHPSSLPKRPEHTNLPRSTSAQRLRPRPSASSLTDDASLGYGGAARGRPRTPHRGMNAPDLRPELFNAYHDVHGSSSPGLAALDASTVPFGDPSSQLPFPPNSFPMMNGGSHMSPFQQWPTVPQFDRPGSFGETHDQNGPYQSHLSPGNLPPYSQYGYGNGIQNMHPNTSVLQTSTGYEQPHHPYTGNYGGAAQGPPTPHHVPQPVQSGSNSLRAPAYNINPVIYGNYNSITMHAPSSTIRGEMPFDLRDAVDDYVSEVGDTVQSPSALIRPENYSPTPFRPGEIVTIRAEIEGKAGLCTKRRIGAVGREAYASQLEKETYGRPAVVVRRLPTPNTPEKAAMYECLILSGFQKMSLTRWVNKLKTQTAPGPDAYWYTSLRVEHPEQPIDWASLRYDPPQRFFVTQSSRVPKTVDDYSWIRTDYMYSFDASHLMPRFYKSNESGNKEARLDFESFTALLKFVKVDDNAYFLYHGVQRPVQETEETNKNSHHTTEAVKEESSLFEAPDGESSHSGSMSISSE